MNRETDLNAEAGAALWLDDSAIGVLRQELLRFARLQLRDGAAAEDVVA